jgi:DNA-binding SARP family transcriptional activator
MVWLRVLGSLEAEVDGIAVPLGGPRQRAVLALLVSARGEVVSVDRMVEDLWHGEPPAQAVTSLQAYVSNLRRLLEPGRAPRAPARLLISAAPGYAVRFPADAVDSWRFERLLDEARAAATPPATARTLLADGLALWRGAAFGEFADEPWAVAEVARLAELRLQAEESIVASTLRSGDAAAAIPGADALTRRQPLREEGWRLLALALWGSSRQGDALGALRRARQALAAELGLDPGPALASLEEAILRQRQDVLQQALHPEPVSEPERAPSPRPRPEQVSEPFVGRRGELSRLAAAAAEVAEGSARIALVTGDPGVGKSAVLRQLGQRLRAGGWLVIGGQAVEAEGAPPAWAWTQALRALAQAAPPPAELAGLLDPLLSHGSGQDSGGAPRFGPAASPPADASAGRFRLHQAVCGWLRAAAHGRRLAIMLDDLHWADSETLALLTAAGTELRDAPILLLGAYRASERNPVLAETLAALARQSPARVPLAGLQPSEVAELVDLVCQTPVRADTMAALAERTGGNPFYVRESSRLLDSEGALVALSEVPEGVADILRRRLARLPGPAVAVLRLAAVNGRETDVDVLIAAAAADEQGVLDALDAGLIAGLLTEPEPGRVRFAHALVRDTMIDDLSQLRRTRMHSELGRAIEQLYPADLSALAYHYFAAASAATAAKAVGYCVRAAELAERRYSHDAAAALLGQALESFERIRGDGPGVAETSDRDADRAALLGRLLRAQVRAGAITAARDTRQRAIDIAAAAGREDLLVAAFTAWTEPTPWQTRPYGTVSPPLIALLTRLLRRPGLSPAERCQLLDALSAELTGEDYPRCRAAAEEAVSLAGQIGDPALRALALTALARARNSDTDWPERGRVAAELIDIATEHDLPAYRSFGGLTAAIAAVADGEVAAVPRLVAEGIELARAYRMPEAEGIGEYGQAMLAHIAGDLPDAERRYTEATARLVTHGSLHAEGFQHLALATLRVGQGRIAEYAPAARELLDAHGPAVADVLALALACGGEPGRARRMLAAQVVLRPDFLLSTLAAFRAMAIIAVGERAETADERAADELAAAEIYQTLLPLADQLPGALSLSLALRPVAHTLGDLALFLGQAQVAAGHFARAVEVAERWQAPHWAADARAAVAAAGEPRGR